MTDNECTNLIKTMVNSKHEQNANCRFILKRIVDHCYLIETIKRAHIELKKLKNKQKADIK